MIEDRAGRTNVARAFAAGWITVLAELVIFIAIIPMWRGVTPELGYLGTLLYLRRPGEYVVRRGISGIGIMLTPRGQVCDGSASTRRFGGRSVPLRPRRSRRRQFGRRVNREPVE